MRIVRIDGLLTVVFMLAVLGLATVAAVFLPLLNGPEPEERRPARELPGPADRDPRSGDEPLPPAAPASLTGHVTGDSGPPGEGAWVLLSGLTGELRANLDQLGNFAFEEVPVGESFDLWLGPDPSGAKICRLLEGLVLAAGEDRFLTVAAPLEIAIRGRVVNETGAPLTDVRVAVLPPLADWRTAVPVAAATGPDGRFYIGFEGRAAPERMRLVVDHVAEGYVLEERLVTPGSPAAGEVLVRLKPGLRIAGRVLLADGSPLAGARVHLLEEYTGDPLARRPSEGQVLTDERGCFTDNAYHPGVYRIFVCGARGGRRLAVVRDGVIAGTTDVEIRVPGYGSLKLAFEDEVSGAPVAVTQGDLELIYGHTGEEEHFECWQSLEGRAEVALPALPEGHYRVRVSADGYESLFSDLLFVKAGEDLGLIRFRLKPTR